MNYANAINNKRFPKPTHRVSFYNQTQSIGVQHGEDYSKTEHIITPTIHRTRLFTLEEVMEIQRNQHLLFLRQRKADEREEGAFRARKKQQSIEYQRQLVEKAKNDKDYVKQCQGKGCSVKLLNITTDDKSKFCRRCFLRKHNRDLCSRCNSSKKKNEFKVCFKCNCELKELLN